MQIESLRYFIALAQAGSFYGAAKNLLISQQGLNKAVTSLETELGIKLVERSRRGVRLTSDGEMFLKHAERIVDDHRGMVDELLEGRFEGPEGEEPITLYVSYYGAQTAVSNTSYIGQSPRTPPISRSHSTSSYSALRSRTAAICATSTSTRKRFRASCKTPTFDSSRS